MSRDSESSAVGSPLDELASRIESELNLVRRDLEGRLGPIEAALEAYRRAVEEDAAREYASSHSIARPKGTGVTPAVAAENLKNAVSSLPELKRQTEQTDVAPRAGHEKPAEELSKEKPTTAASRQRPLHEALPRIAAACEDQKLVIVGAMKGRKKPLPSPLDTSTEWIDTSDGGAHAIGNLPQRIRQGRVFGVIICDQAVQHKHSEPLVSAARAVKVPVGFAGKGGAAGMARALEAVEEQLPA